MKRILDIVISSLLIIFFSPLYITIFLYIFLVEKLKPIYWSERVGKDSAIFLMPKFRTMKENTPQIATHLLDQSRDYMIGCGKFLRKTSLDELPQLFLVLNGTMSLVGPRPALYNQYDLIKGREKLGINNLKPGITGYAQINGRDNISILKKIEFDEYYLKNKNFFLDIKILIITVIKTLLRKEISH